MSGFWRKILDKKANATHTPQPGDWAAMQSMLDKSPVLGKPAAGSNGAAGSSSIIGGSTIIKGIVAVVVSLSAYTTYVVLNEDESSTGDSYYYQARIESENTSDEMPVSLEDQDQKATYKITTQKPLETDDKVESSLVTDLSHQHSNAARTPLENELEDVGAPTTSSDKIVSDEIDGDKKLYDEGTAAEQQHQPHQTSDPVNPDAETVLADNDLAGEIKDSEATANSDAIGSEPKHNASVNSMDSDNPGPVVGQKYSGNQNEREAIVSEEPTVVKDSSEAPYTIISDNGGARLEEQYEEEEEGEDESSVIVDALKRMEFNSVAAGLSYSSVNSTTDYFAPGAAVELEWRLSHWRLQTGLAYHSWYESGRTKSEDFSYVDTSYSLTTETREVSWVDSSWVVTGINQGEYVYDTSSALVTDTVYNMNLDSMHISTEHPVPATFMSSRFAIPIRLSYRKRFGSFYGDLGAAMISNFTTYQSGYVGDAQKTSFSLDVALRPALGYQINRKWGAELGFNYNIPVYQGIADEMVFDRGQYWSLSLGIRYFLD